MKIMKTRELPDGTGVLLVSCVYLSFQRSDLPLIRSAMREVMHFVMLKKNRKLEDQSYIAMRQLEKDHDFTSEHCDADDIEVPGCKVAFEKGLEEIVLIIYKYSTDDKYRRDFSLLADHFGIQEKKVSKGKYKRNKSLLDHNEHLHHFRMETSELSVCYDSLNTLAFKLLSFVKYRSKERKIIRQFLKSCKEVVQIHKHEQRQADDFHRRNPNIIY